MRKMFLLLVGTAACAGGWAAVSPGVTSDPNPLELARALNRAFSEVADRVSPAVVVVRVAHKLYPVDANDPQMPMLIVPPGDRQESRPWQPPWPLPLLPPRPPTPAKPEPVFDGHGSGIVIREDGYILTSFHVVDDVERVRVRLQNGALYEAVIRGTDPGSDLAVLKIEAWGLPVVRWGDSDAVRPGEWAIAIGAPFALEHSVTIGHISATGRSAVMSGEDDDFASALIDADFLQTDASLNPGNSGGPLVNVAGEVIGINCFIKGLNSGIGFAIPANLAREVARQLIAQGRFTRPWLGLSIRSLQDDDDYRPLLSGVSAGVVVAAILPDGPAARSPLQPGDVITAVDGRPVSSAPQLSAAVRRKPIGSPIPIEVRRPQAGRSPRPLRIEIAAEPRPEDARLVASEDDGSPADNSRGLGLTLRNCTRERAASYDVEFRPGVIVTSVAARSSADRKGLRVGDIVTAVNHQVVTNLDQFRAALRAADLKRGVALNFFSDETGRFEVLKKDAE